MDVHSKKQRSYNMSRIKGSNTKAEVLLQKLIRELKIPFKKNFRGLPGKPDIFIPDLDLVIEVHGCFWHGHKNCRYFILPKSNVDFWNAKIRSNISRDQRIKTDLKRRGLKVCTLWECDFKNGNIFEKLFKLI